MRKLLVFTENNNGHEVGDAVVEIVAELREGLHKISVWKEESC